ncbi:MAG: glycosyltransferase family 4 protein [Chitinophagaceae bacterium]|nr:glycosyltransferase family 4 protein [Chitinophagaceae bacterium]
MIRINYITNLDVNKYSGGWSAMNHHVYQQLKQSDNHSINLIQDVNPPVSLLRKTISKLRRIAGLKGEFFYFSVDRLKKIKAEVELKQDQKSDLDFYHGATPWILVKQSRPYMLYLDACFATYIDVYHKREKFLTSHLENIHRTEARFLEKAAHVFFSSQWALNQAIAAYNLTGDNFSVAGLGGNIPIPAQLKGNYKNYFLFVGLDFLGKGGMLVAQAFNAISKKYPGFSLQLVGGKPPDEVLNNPSVRYLGYFNKSDQQQFLVLQKIFEEAYALVLPTNKDITPLVIAEAGYYGCPSIAVRNFGIPEMIENGKTGVLIESPPNIQSLITAMEMLCNNHTTYQKMRLNAFNYFSDTFTWQRTGTIINNTILNFLKKLP